MRTLLLAGLFCMSLSADDKTLAVKVGDEMPAVKLPGTQLDKVLPDAKDAKELDLAAFKGKKSVVLFFYPKAMTGGCTKESCRYRDLQAEFAKLDAVVLGISTDDITAQRKFTDKENLNMPLLADPDKKVSSALGVMKNDKVTRRVTFVVGKDGRIAKIFDDVKDAAKHPDEVLEFVKSMK